MAKKTAAKKKTKKSKVKKVKGITQFKLWCVKNSITQVELRKQTELSIGCIHATWHDGRASKSTIKLIALTLGKDENEIQSMISNFVENDASKKVKIKSVKKRLKSLETIVKDSKNETNDAAEKTAQ